MKNIRIGISALLFAIFIAAATSVPGLDSPGAGRWDMFSSGYP